jgi:hypothetical protein
MVITIKRQGKKMRCKAIEVLLAGSVLWASAMNTFAAQQPDGTLKITRRSVSEGVGLSWGDGVLTYKGKDYSFSFQASGLSRKVDVGVTAAELSGQVFNLKKLDDFNGNYKSGEGGELVGGGGSRATLKNQNGVVVNVISTTAGRQFQLGADGMNIELKK